MVPGPHKVETKICNETLKVETKTVELLLWSFIPDMVPRPLKIET